MVKKVSTPKPMCHDFATKLKVLKILNFSFIKFFWLIGTDFYVVWNHRSEKDMVAAMLKNLIKEDFD